MANSHEASAHLQRPSTVVVFSPTFTVHPVLCDMFVLLDDTTSECSATLELPSANANGEWAIQSINVMPVDGDPLGYAFDSNVLAQSMLPLTFTVINNIEDRQPPELLDLFFVPPVYHIAQDHHREGPKACIQFSDPQSGLNRGKIPVRWRFSYWLAY